MLCPKCLCEIPDESKVCPVCGVELTPPEVEVEPVPEVKVLPEIQIEKKKSPAALISMIAAITGIAAALAAVATDVLMILNIIFPVYRLIGFFPYFGAILRGIGDFVDFFGNTLGVFLAVGLVAVSAICGVIGLITGIIGKKNGGSSLGLILSIVALIACAVAVLLIGLAVLLYLGRGLLDLIWNAIVVAFAALIAGGDFLAIFAEMMSSMM